MSHCDCCGNHEIVRALKEVLSEMKELNKKLDDLTIVVSESSDGGRTHRVIGDALRVTNH